MRLRGVPRQARMARMEPTEMQEFAKQVKEGGEESLTSISLAISILAVLVAMVTVLGHRSHTEAVLMQSRAGDQWNLYQAKKIRQDSLEVVIDQLACSRRSDAKATAAKITEYKAHIAKWEDDLGMSRQRPEEFEDGVSMRSQGGAASTWARRCCRSRWCSRRSRCSPGGEVFCVRPGAGRGRVGGCGFGVAGALRPFAFQTRLAMFARARTEHRPLPASSQQNRSGLRASPRAAFPTAVPPAPSN